MRSRFMNDAQPDIHRQLAQQAFEESLNTLKDLSVSLDEPSDATQITAQAGEIDWDDVADDLEKFFGEIATSIASDELPPPLSFMSTPIKEQTQQPEI